MYYGLGQDETMGIGLNKAGEEADIGPANANQNEE